MNKNISHILLAGLLGIGLNLHAAQAPFGFVLESARRIPVAHEADVVVVGGTSHGVAVAVAAAKAGAKVFLLAPRTYLGEDLAGTLRLWLEPDEKVNAPLAQAVFGKERHVTPGAVKEALDNALVEAKVDFLYGCYAADVLTDAAGQPCGVVMANRSGRQAIVAKVIVDATENATVARLAGAKFTPFAAGPQKVRWITIAGQARTEAGQAARKLPLPVEVTGRTIVFKGGAIPKAPIRDDGVHWWEYTLGLDFADGSWAARARLEQQVREQTYHDSQLYAADIPFVIPADAIVSARPVAGSWPGAAQVSLDAFRPANVERLWVMGACAALPREQVELLLRPVACMEVGERIGKAAAEEAAKTAAPQAVRLARAKVASAVAGDVKEGLAGIRWSAQPVTVPQDAGGLPILAAYDVVVVGGGTAGAPAGIGAARQGARTLVIEYLHGLGGVGTLGMIGGYWHGNKVGFTSQIPASPIEKRMEWYRRELAQAKADVWFGVLGCGAFVEGQRVTGVVAATPYGRGVVLAKAVVDGTGNSDLPIAAGSQFVFVDDPRDAQAVQAAHLPPRYVGSSYINGNRPAVDEADPVSVKSVFQGTRRWNGQIAFDQGQHLDSRERRRIVGDYTLDWLDILNQRTFPDSIVLAKSNYDSHGGNTHPYFRICDRKNMPRGPGGGDYYAYVPYRCLLPKGLEGVLVVGLGISAHRDAMPIVRMQPDQHNLGYAAGVAAAMAAKAGVTPRQIDVKSLQRHLVEVGNLKPSVLTDRDSYPMPEDRIAAAVKDVTKDFEDVQVLLAQPQQAIPPLRRVYESAQGDDKTTYARLLAMMGDGTGVPTLLEALKAMGQKGKAGGHANTAEQLILALGYARDCRAVPALVELAAQRASLTTVAEALGRIGDPAGAAPLADYLALKGRKPNERNDLIFACALWRCGDKDDVARKTLESFAAGENSLYAHLARKLLASGSRRRDGAGPAGRD